MFLLHMSYTFVIWWMQQPRFLDWSQELRRVCGQRPNDVVAAVFCPLFLRRRSSLVKTSTARKPAKAASANVTCGTGELADYILQDKALKPRNLPIMSTRSHVEAGYPQRSTRAEIKKKMHMTYRCVMLSSGVGMKSSSPPAKKAYKE